MSGWKRETSHYTVVITVHENFSWKMQETTSYGKNEASEPNILSAEYGKMVVRGDALPELLEKAIAAIRVIIQ